MTNEAPLSPWQRIANKALEQIPQLVVATLGALVVFCAGLWVGDREHAHAIADLQRVVDALRGADGALGTTLADLSAAPSASRPATSSSISATASPASKAIWGSE